MLVTKEKSLAQWQASHPLLTELSNVHELFWFNPLKKPFAEIRESLPLQQNATEEAAQRLQRFAAYISLVFPETQSHKGLIESPLKPIPNYLKVINAKADFPVTGSLWLKCDSHLPISGSIKARGGIYEVLKYAEEVALSSGALTQEQCYSVLAEPAFKNLFAQYQIVVGSTGNLGLSIGIMAAKLGFSVTVHMSADARKWKKDLLRSKGVIVVEYEADYSKAVEEGRKQAEAQDKCHFVDDENSHDLFLGYSVAGQRLKAQMDQQGVIVDREHPLFVYLPCGVGGGPGGVAFGLKQAFGDNVHCFFAEPTHSPCMLLGMYTGLHDAVCVQDIGIDNKTCADGLAVGRASAFVGRFMQPLLTGLYTVEDNELYRQLACLRDAEDISLEPSALAGAVGPVRLTKELASQSANPFSNTQLKQATHLIWATGGSMVPKNESEVYYQMGKSVG